MILTIVTLFLVGVSVAELHAVTRRRARSIRGEHGL